MNTFVRGGVVGIVVEGNNNMIMGDDHG